MQTIRLEQVVGPLQPCAVTVGFFDGVHLGHQHLIKQVCEAAHARGMEAAVATFARHPRQVLKSDYKPRLLSPLDEKIRLFEQTDIDRLVVLPFDRAMSELTAYEFMDQVLFQRIGARLLVTGYDNRFGHNREEGFPEYVAYGHQLGLAVGAATPFSLNGVTISSTVVRVFLEAGDVEMAERCLGHRYSITGKVVPGHQFGRQMGFPSANLQLLDPLKLIPRNGVYGIRCTLGSQQYEGMMNIGMRPTFMGSDLTIEVHLFGFSGNLYGQHLTVELVCRHRSERRFTSRGELARQLQRDAAELQQRMCQSR